MTSLDLAFRLIAIIEGLRLTAYFDHYGKVWTIGFGHTLGVMQGQVISKDQAIKFFKADSEPLYELVQDRPIFEAAAYISFGYNVGKHALQSALANNTPEFLLNFNHSGGIVVDNLTRRREVECAMIQASRQK